MGRFPSNGSLNIEEYGAGTDPLDPGSCLEIVAAGEGTGGRGFELSWQASKFRHYRIDFREHLTEGDWSDKREKLDPYGISDASPEAAANTLICLANQAIYLLKRQIETLERDFVEQGGFTEKLYRVRSQRRHHP